MCDGGVARAGQVSGFVRSAINGINLHKKETAMQMRKALTGQIWRSPYLADR